VEQQTGERFACPWHGSRFALDGQVQHGPADKPLRHVALDLDQDGQVVVDRGQMVVAAWRMKPAS
jgi:Rieske Fe-S protein